jgi:polar amino acid transport system substrate-binding protein
VLRELVLCGALLCGACAAYAQPGDACGDLSLACYEMDALYYHAPDGGWAGIDKDVIDELARRTGCRFQTTRESRVRIWSQLARAKLDMSVSGIATPERERFARFIPYFSTRNYVLMRQDLRPDAASAHDWFCHARLPEPTAQRMATAIRAMRADGTQLAIFKRHIGPGLAGDLINY